MSTKVIWTYVDHDSTIGNTAITSVQTHAIYDNATIFRGRCYYLTSWAHTEAIRSTACFFIMVHERVFCCTEAQARWFHAILGLIDYSLIMFNTNTDSKWFCRHFHIAFIKHFVCVTRTMAYTRQNNSRINTLTTINFNAYDTVIFNK